MSIKLENDDEQNQRSRLKWIIRQRIESQSITQSTEKSIEKIAQDDGNERNLRSRLKKGIILKTEPLLIAQTQTPFIEEMESDEEDQEIETEEEFVETTEEQEERRRLIHAYLTSTMEKEEKNRMTEESCSMRTQNLRWTTMTNRWNRTKRKHT